MDIKHLYLPASALAFMSYELGRIYNTVSIAGHSTKITSRQLETEDCLRVHPNHF